MRRIAPETWSGLVMLALCVGVGLPVLLRVIEPAIPFWAWSTLFVLVLAAMLVVAVGEELPGRPRRVVLYACYGFAVLGGWVLVYTVTGSGLLDILVVMIAAIGTGLVPLRVSAVTILLNCAVIVASHAQVRASVPELAMLGLFYLMIQSASVLSVTALLREQRMRRELSEAHVELQAASVLLEGSARTAERLRIARELHDLVGHQLTVLTLELEAARHRDGTAAKEHIDRADAVARALLGDVRATVSELRELAPGGLAAALAAVGRDVPGLEVRVEVQDEAPVDEEQGMVLVRAVQEIVTNTLRHADAQEVSVVVRRDGDRLRLFAGDDGQGARQIVPGNGLRGLSERFAQLGGAVAYAGDDGFTVDAWLPVR
jgi:signal transduction histidine kinase